MASPHGWLEAATTFEVSPKDNMLSMKIESAYWICICIERERQTDRQRQTKEEKREREREREKKCGEIERDRERERERKRERERDTLGCTIQSRRRVSARERKNSKALLLSKQGRSLGNYVNLP